MNKFTLFLLCAIVSGSIAGCSRHDREADTIARLELQKAQARVRARQETAEIQRRKKERELFVLKAAIEHYIYLAVAVDGERVLRDSRLNFMIITANGDAGMSGARMYEIRTASLNGTLHRTVASMFPHSDTPLRLQTDHGGVLRFTPEEATFGESIDVEALSDAEIRRIFRAK